MTDTLIKKIEHFLKSRTGEPTTNRGMADAFVHEMYVDEYKHKRGGAIQLSAEINKYLIDMMNSGNYPDIKIIEGVRPKTYCWGAVKDSYVKPKQTNTKNQRSNKPKGKDEKGLYEPLIKFLKEDQGIYAVRIDERKTIDGGKRRKNKNKWRHPDVVGVEGLISGKKLHHSIQTMAKLTIDRAKLHAYEVKETVTGSTLRDDFHQTVSNTIWANYGYLCAENFDEDPEFEKELHQLNKAYGIGIIIIDRKNPIASNIHIEAREKKVDLEICSTLTETNKNFQDFIGQALDVFETGNVRFF